VEGAVFVFAQLFGGVALAANERLLALPLRRHGVLVGLRDLDVVAEDAVVAHLERLDAGAFALPPFEVGQVPAGVARRVTERVEFLREAGSDDGGWRWIIADRRGDQRGGLAAEVEVGDETSTDRAPAFGDCFPERGERLQAAAEGDEVAWRRGSRCARGRRRDAGQRALEVTDPGKRFEGTAAADGGVRTARRVPFPAPRSASGRIGSKISRLRTVPGSRSMKRPGRSGAMRLTCPRTAGWFSAR
jgi:hypothetical protein